MSDRDPTLRGRFTLHTRPKPRVVARCPVVHLNDYGCCIVSDCITGRNIDMAHLEPQYTNEDFHMGVKRNGGDTVALPASVHGSLQSFAFEEDCTDCEIESGWWARLSAPGYMDCTDWNGPFDTEEEAKEFIREQYDVDPETGNELPDAERPWELRDSTDLYFHNVYAFSVLAFDRDQPDLSSRNTPSQNGMRLTPSQIADTREMLVNKLNEAPPKPTADGQFYVMQSEGDYTFLQMLMEDLRAGKVVNSRLSHEHAVKLEGVLRRVELMQHRAFMKVRPRAARAPNPRTFAEPDEAPYGEDHPDYETPEVVVDPVTGMPFRALGAEEEASFRKWARDNFKPGNAISNAWHPVVRDECTKMSFEADTYALDNYNNEGNK